MVLQVGIVGAGIAGLSAAIALRRAGAEVEVFERSQFKNEVGAAISITPNATRVLARWGFDFKKACAVTSEQIRVVSSHTLEPMFQSSFADATDKFGYPFQHYHRVDLHRGLRELAEGLQGVGKPAVIRLGQQIVDIDCGKGEIVLKDETKVVKDLVIVADGIGSGLNSKIAGRGTPLEKTGWSMYRGLIPMEQLRSPSTHPDLASVFAPDVPPGFWTPVDLSTAFFFVTYPCRDGRVLNLALRCTTLPHQEENDDWHSDARLEDALKVVEGYHPAMEELLRMVEPGELKVYNLLRREPFGQVVNGRAVLVGDSAETVQPTHAQGGVLAIEQAGALEVFFRDLMSSQPSPSAEDVNSRLLLYQSLLLPRIHLNQHLTDAQPMSRDSHRQKAEAIVDEQVRLAEGRAERARREGKCAGTATGGKPLFSFDAGFFGPDIQEFFWSWNVIGEAEAVLDMEKEKKTKLN